MRVALFDIDGTILLAHGAGRRAMERALLEVTGTPGNSGLHYAGKTDGQIVREAMRAHGHADGAIDSRMAAVLAAYVENLSAELRNDAHERIAILPGINAVLDACEAHDGVLLGLLTGNLVNGAKRKLTAAGVDPARFTIGAYGSDHEDRNTLAAVARDRAAQHLGADVRGAECVVIGDTPADVACGRAIGARTIAVATGNYTVPALRDAGATVVFDDLSDTPAVMAAILDG
jgi:phosphoglycolate phosphatase-like HAD superfamily hydrolase